jgi:hypothetical protein
MESLIFKYEEELRGGGPSKGLRPALNWLGGEINQQLAHAYILARYEPLGLGGSGKGGTCWAFYQFPYSECLGQSAPLGGGIELLTGKASRLSPEDVKVANGVLGRQKDYQRPMGELKVFGELFGKERDEYGFLKENSIRRLNRGLTTFLSSGKAPSGYPAKLFEMEAQLFSEWSIFAATNLFHGGLWTGILLVLQSFYAARPSKSERALVHYWMSRFRPLVAEKIYHLVYEWRFLEQPLRDNVGWGITELHRLAYGLGCTNVKVDVKALGFTVKALGKDSEASEERRLKIQGKEWNFSFPLKGSSPKIVEAALGRIEKTLDLAYGLRAALEHNAIAAIMSRNMSHNIGSHALARIHADTLTGPAGGSRAGGPKDAERLLQYMQERMDFVARVATEWPSWREPVLFYGDLMRGFLKQGLLLDNLVADDGFPAEKIVFKIQGPYDGNGNWVETEWRAAKDGREDEQYSEFYWKKDGCKRDWAPQDFLAAIPGGPVGRQAFYGFLENAMRNAAKHNLGRQLEVTLKVALPTSGAAENRFYHVSYQDNLSSAASLDKVKFHLAQDLVDESGKTVSEGWGIQEMKVYARFLAHPQEDWVAPDSPEKLPGPLGAIEAGPLHSSGSGSFLTYTFGLQRPCLALVPKSMVGATEDKVLAPYGVECYDGTPRAEQDKAFRELVRASSPGLLYLIAPEAQEELTGLLNWLKANRLWLPARILLRPANRGAEQLFEKLKDVGLAHRVRVDYEDTEIQVGPKEPGRNKPDPASRLVVELYRRWLVALAKERGYTVPFRLVVYFDRDNSTFADRWASLKDAVGAHGVHADEFLVVYPVYKQQVQDGTPQPVTLSPWKPVARQYCMENQNTCRFGALNMPSGQQTGTWLLFDNHENGRPTDLTQGSEAFYQHLGNIKDLQNNREAFERLANVPQGFAGVLFLLQLVESCLLKVLVLDERVAQTVLEVKESNLDLVKQSWYQRWYWAGLRLAPLFHWRDGRLCHVGKASNVENIRGKALNGLGITFKDGGNPEITQCVVIGKDRWGDDKVALDQAAPFDALVIHRGLLETLARQLGGARAEDFEKGFLDALHTLGARVLVTSGRGAQLDGPCGDYPFVEYSILEATVVRELSKPSLGSVLMATIGR